MHQAALVGMVQRFGDARDDLHGFGNGGPGLLDAHLEIPALDEFGDEYFENYQVTPYMDCTLAFKESVKQKVPAIVHVNATGRLQSVRREWNQRYYDLIHCFYQITGIPMLLNTSFNIMGKPVIHSLEDALGLFYTTGLDALVVEDYLIEKKGL